MAQFGRAGRSLSRFRTERAGSVAIMAGFMFTALVVAIGGAVDYSSTIANSKKAQRMMDSTVLALTRQELNTDDLQQKGEALFTSLLAKASLNSEAKEITFTLDNDIVRGTAVVGSATNFLSIIGLDRLRARIEAAAVAPELIPMEIALVLDVSGSMGTDLNGKPRIEWLKDSVNGMFDTLDENLPPSTQLSAAIVPYSTSVNLGDYPQVLAALSVGSKAKPTNGGDVWAAERVDAANGLDFNLKTTSATVRPVPFVDKFEVGGRTPKSRFQPLTSDIASARKAVDKLVAQGWTAGHIGMAWGLYALASEWQDVWPEPPAPYAKSKKAIVILSDGQFNTTHNIGNTSLANDDSVGVRFKNDNTAESDAYFQDVCELAEDRGIIVYAVALALDPVSEAKMGDCVANSGQLFKADSPAELRKAFEAIALELGERRLVS